MSARLQTLLAGLCAAVAWIAARLIASPAAGAGDVGTLEHAARLIDAGRIPWRDFDVDAGPAAIALGWLLHHAPGPTGAAYWFVIGLALAVATATATATAIHLGLGPRRTAGVAAAMAAVPFLVGPQAQARLDLVVTCLLAAAALMALRRRFTWMWVLVATAAAITPAPIALVPLLVMWQRAHGADPGRATRQAAVAVGAVVATLLPFALIAPGAVGRFAWAHVTRPLQVESLGATVVRLTGIPARRVTDLDSHALAGAGAALIAAACTVALVAAVAVIARRARPRLRSDGALVAAVAATLLATVTFGRALPAVHLVWALPAALLVPGRLGVVAAAGTALAAPVAQLVGRALLADIVDRVTPTALAALGLRSVLLLVALGATTAAIGARPPRGTGAPTAHSP